VKGERLKVDAQGTFKSATKRSVMYEIQNRHLFGYPGPALLALSCNPKAYVYGEELEIWAVDCLGSRREGKTCPGIMILDDYSWHKK
jgi:hypothetical protein